MKEKDCNTMRIFELMYYSPFIILCCMPSLPHYQSCSSNFKQKTFGRRTENTMAKTVCHGFWLASMQMVSERISQSLLCAVWAQQLA